MSSTETLDKNKKTLMLVFRCWHYKNKQTMSAELFEVMNEMFIFIVFLFNLSICVVGLSSLYSNLWFSPVASYHSNH